MFDLHAFDCHYRMTRQFEINKITISRAVLMRPLSSLLNSLAGLGGNLCNYVLLKDMCLTPECVFREKELFRHRKMRSMCVQQLGNGTGAAW